MKIYIAGPMKNHKWFNVPAFDEAEHQLTKNGWEVFSPASMDIKRGFDVFSLSPNADWSDVTKAGIDLRAVVKLDIEAIFGSDAIFMLYGWEVSKGAVMERALAHLLDIPIYYQQDGYPSSNVFRTQNEE